MTADDRSRLQKGRFRRHVVFWGVRGCSGRARQPDRMGAIGHRNDAPMVLLMAVGGAALFMFMRFFIRAATD